MAKIAWGKVTYYEVNKDTQKVAEFDKWLASHKPDLAHEEPTTAHA